MEGAEHNKNVEAKNDNFSSTMTILRPFGPSIAKVRMPSVMVNRINDHLSKELRSATNKVDMGLFLASNVTQEIRLDDSFVEKSGLLQFLAKSAENWIQQVSGKNISQFKLMSSWAVRQFKHEYKPVHFHGGHISGVGYLELPDEFGFYAQSSKKGNLNGHIQFINGTPQFLSNAVMSARPKVGDFYLFPNYLLHTVYPFFAEGERRSLSFNALIDQNIFSATH
tara:strand:+ start:90 stop:761 length:672 start_codon:yes stop_codon:yes gene_type:complete